jgi:hypothetical protein
MADSKTPPRKRSLRPGSRRPRSRPSSGVPTSRESKERVTFRVAPDLASALRRLPNQTAFVERVLRSALGHICPLCLGSGQAPGVQLSVSDLKGLQIGRLDRPAAAQLRAIVRLGRAVLATDLELEPSEGSDGPDPELDFRLARDQQLLLSGRIARGRSQVRLPN